MIESEADRILWLTAERDAKREKAKKEVCYREQVTDCCDTCIHGSYEEGWVWCELLEDFCTTSAICNKYEGGI